MERSARLALLSGNCYNTGMDKEHFKYLAIFAMGTFVVILCGVLLLCWGDVRHAFGVGRISSASDVDDSDKIHSVLVAEDAIELEWYRSRLDSDEKVALYDAMEAAVASMSMGVSVPNMPEEDVLECYWSVIYDHPEFFWLTRTYHYYVDADGMYTAFDFDYFFDDKAEVQSKMRDIEAAADAVITGSYLDNILVKMEYIYKWVGGTTKYKEGAHDQTMLGVFVDHEAVCAGYVQAVQYLWLRAGVPCVRISGHEVERDGSVSDGNHTWLCAVPTNHMFFYDVTWDDQQNAYRMEEYYRMEQTEFDETHVAESDKAPREDDIQDDTQELVEMAVRVSDGTHLEMPARISIEDTWDWPGSM